MEKLANPSRRLLFRGKVNPKQEMRLPWIIDEARFVDLCTQCQECISVCETHIIKSDDLGFPKIDFRDDECTFCQQCINVCEQPFFHPVNKRESMAAWPVRFEIKESCLAFHHVFCQSCKDGCEPQAITFHYETSSIPTPKLNIDSCNQCGACVSVCPQEAIQPCFTHTKF